MFSNIFLRGMMLMNNVRYTVADHIHCEGKAWDFLTEEGDGGIFDSVANSIKQIGASITKIFSTAAFAIIACALISFGVCFIVTKQGMKLQELKGQIPWVFVGIIFVVGFAAIFYIGEAIANGIIVSLK